jgi:hypothetical protein
MIITAIKSIAPKSFVVLSLFVVLAATAASARAQSADAIAFRVPFEFTAGDVRMPAGDYVIRRASQSGQAYFIQSRDGRKVAAVTVKNVLVETGKGAQLPQLTFNVYGDQHYLSQLRPGGGARGAEFHRSRVEREVARNAAESRRVSVVALNR